MNRIVYFFFLILGFSSSQAVFAVDRTWTGTLGTNWATSGNWSPAGVPTASDHVYIDDVTNDPIILNGTTANVLSIGVNAGAKLTINAGATLNITMVQSTVLGIAFYGGAVTNNGTLAITFSGSIDASSGQYGLYFADGGTLTNGGTLTINSTRFDIVYFSSNCSITNTSSGVMNLSTTQNFRCPGPSTGRSFTNQGILHLTENFIIENGCTVTNSGTIDSFSETESSIYVTSGNTFTNQACGKVTFNTSGYINSGMTTNAGLIQVGGQLDNTDGTFTNNGVLKYASQIGNAVVNATNSSVIVNNTPTPIFTYGGTYTGSVNGIYTNATATTLAGTFTAPNTFTPSGLPNGSQTLYAKITPSGGACTYIVPFTYNYVAPPTITNFAATPTPVCANGTITFTATIGNVTGSYAYTITNGSSTSISGSTSNTSLSIDRTASGSATQSFTLTVINNSLSTTASTDVTVTSLPTATLTNNGPLSCTQTSVTLTASGGSSYTFTNSSGSVVSGSGNTRLITEPGMYSVTVANASGCVSSTTTTVSSTTVLSVSAGSSLPQANVGVVVSLTASGATSYQWTAPSTASLTTPATSSAVSASLTTAGVQTFTVVATAGVCSQSALVSMTALAGPDLSAIMSLPNGNFTTGESKGLLIQLQEVNGSSASGSIVITITVPTGYSVSFDNSLTSINVSGGSNNPVTVQNSKWHISNQVAGQQLSLTINGGESVGANATLNLGFTITRTTANAGSTSNITINVADDGGGSYDVNRLNNIYARIINGL